MGFLSTAVCEDRAGTEGGALLHSPAQPWQPALSSLLSPGSQGTLPGTLSDPLSALLSGIHGPAIRCPQGASTVTERGQLHEVDVGETGSCRIQPYLFLNYREEKTGASSETVGKPDCSTLRVMGRGPSSSPKGPRASSGLLQSPGHQPRLFQRFSTLPQPSPPGATRRSNFSNNLRVCDILSSSSGWDLLGFLPHGLTVSLRNWTV